MKERILALSLMPKVCNITRAAVAGAKQLLKACVCCCAPSAPPIHVSGQ